MRSFAVISMVLLLLSAMDVKAQEKVLIYLKDGKVVQGQVVGMTPTIIKLDPDGPVTLCTYATTDVDSVVALSGKTRVIFPFSQEKVSANVFGHYRPPRSPLGNKIAIGLYGGYRMDHTIDQGEVQYTSGPYGRMSLDLEGNVVFGIWMGYMLGVRQSRIQFFSDIGFSSATLSLNLDGERLAAYSWNYLQLDFGIKPMLPLINSRVKLYVSPLAGIGFMVTNVQQSSSYYYTYYSPYPNRFDSEFDAFYGLSLDLHIGERFSASAGARYVNSKYYLNTSSFSVPELRLGFSYLTE